MVLKALHKYIRIYLYTYISVQKSPANLAPIGQLKYKGNAVDLVDEGTTPPQKLILRTVRAEYTKLAKIPFVSICVIRGSLCAFCAFSWLNKIRVNLCLTREMTALSISWVESVVTFIFCLVLLCT